jgi:hypothetical protein
MWNSAMWVNLSVVYNSSSVHSVTEEVYETHDSIYFIFNSPALRLFHRPALQDLDLDLDRVTAVPARSANAKLDKGVATKRSF